MLHVTNGDSTVANMGRTRLGGDMVPWRDVLHEGPVPPLPPDELRRVRADYLATIGTAGAADVEAALRARDARLAAALADGEPVVLWFEHDQYDQLQLIQILAGLPDRPEHVELICVGSFPGRPGFAGMAAEEAPFMGDTIAFDRLEELAPLLVDGAAESDSGGSAALADGGLRITELGEAVLAGRADRVALLGFDRWIGGLHVRAEGPLWRWDHERAVVAGP